MNDSTAKNQAAAASPENKTQGKAQKSNMGLGNTGNESNSASPIVKVINEKEGNKHESNVGETNKTNTNESSEDNQTANNNAAQVDVDSDANIKDSSSSEEDGCMRMDHVDPNKRKKTRTGPKNTK
jgi:hypothetical protein